MVWTSPFAGPGNWYRGNLHTHSTQSDGVLSPEDAIAFYRARGYDFVALSDHWVLTPGRVLDGGFATLSAAELQDTGYHLLALGLRDLPPREWAEEPQRIIDHVKAQGGLAYMAHPYWTGRPSAETMALTGLDGIEAYNAVCEATKGTGHGRVWWDDCLTAGMRLTGLAVDDSHWHGWGEGTAYVMVRAEALNEPAILRALADGHFYASTGPAILDLRVDHQADGTDALNVHCSPCTEVVFYAAGPRGGRFVPAPGKRLTHARLPLQAGMQYVRVECRDGDTCAWSNPVYLSDLEAYDTPAA